MKSVPAIFNPLRFGAGVIGQRHPVENLDQAHRGGSLIATPHLLFNGEDASNHIIGIDLADPLQCSRSGLEITHGKLLAHPVPGQGKIG